MERWYVICNPASGRSSGHSNRSRLEHGLRAAGIAHQIAMSEYPGHAAELARAACRNGWRRIAIAGGDGTAHQALNGILGSGFADLAHMTLGVLPLGTGNDWARTLGVPTNVESACHVLGAGQAVFHDVGEVALRIDGQPKNSALHQYGRGRLRCARGASGADTRRPALALYHWLAAGRTQLSGSRAHDICCRFPLRGAHTGGVSQYRTLPRRRHARCAAGAI
ncbi:MAG: acylglycerol kinase family protein [Gammaproteobacteria bacterium]|nr:acylglycerol kinase family protein [Gammaproteobacteria bacterium]